MSFTGRARRLNEDLYLRNTSSTIPRTPSTVTSRSRLQPSRSPVSASKVESNSGHTFSSTLSAPARVRPPFTAPVTTRSANPDTVWEIRKRRCSQQLYNSIPQGRVINMSTRRSSSAEAERAAWLARASPLMRPHETLARAVVERTNAYRYTKGLPAVKFHLGICNVAATHSADMAAGRVPFAHVGFSRRVSALPWQASGAAENLAVVQGGDTVEQAVQGWIHSPGHEQNLRSRCEWCGVGVAEGADGKVYLTQIFSN